MPVYWTIQARRHLRQALARSLGQEGATEAEVGPGVLEAAVANLGAMLDAAFGKVVVVVKDQVIGYRRKRDQFTLLVEAFGEDDTRASGPYVVKIGPKDKMDREFAGWKSCRPPGLRHDLVFLSLDEREETRKVGEEWWSCLVYGDAQQFLGVAFTIPFEEAALECVRSGFPGLLSVAVVINELYERAGHLFYSQAFVDDPSPIDDEPGAPPYVLDVPNLDDALARWEAEPACKAARREANSLPDVGAEKFIDPVDYLRYVQAFVPHVSEAGEVRHPAPIGGGPASGYRVPSTSEVVPRMLRGCAHGDLHGRNILVGIVQDQAMWPTVFDYEDMGPRNLIGWDFVKLETELKIRGLGRAFPGKESTPFAEEVQRFEIDLDRRTEDCYLGAPWPDVGDPPGRADRLAMIVLSIRRMAARHLGTNHGRPNEWLEEYYFLLACYGVATGRFANLQPRERMAALISSGVAASRLSWVRAVEKDRPTRFSSDPGAETPGYHVPLALARSLGRSREPEARVRAVELLRRLVGRYPHALAIGQELVLVLMEGGDAEGAEAALREFEGNFRNLGEEFLCRWGRLFKDRGDAHVPLPWRDSADEPNPALAGLYYRKSLEKYAQAYALREGHYPGINKATLLVILASLAPPPDPATWEREVAEWSDLAGKILASHPTWRAVEVDDAEVWFPATKGEAHLIRREWDQAAAHYGQALGSSRLNAHAREAMGRQVGRIVLCFEKLGILPGHPFDRPATLFEGPGALPGAGPGANPPDPDPLGPAKGRGER